VKKPQGLGERIAQSRRVLGVREQRDVTQLDLAKAAGVSGPTVSDWEAGKKVPREAALMKLADYLGVTPAYLRYGIMPVDPPALPDGEIRHDVDAARAENHAKREAETRAVGEGRGGPGRRPKPR
jgi:transcriptional regulator with XRE-family HTH domain